MSSPAHKPRKRKKDSNGADLVGKPSALRKEESRSSELRQPPFPLAAFLWPARGGTSQWVILPLILMITGLYRWAVGFWGYSGFQSPPMHGDFEAQRHWMEITTHLPITQWYFHDLDWWGLDYPPLTAYHSLLFGKLGALINPQWYSLHTSRGLDDPTLKIYMRATVLASEYIVYIPAVVLFCRYLSRLQRVSSLEASVALVAILMQPATILVDHAHFQYNTVMLGFVVASATCMISNRYLWGSIFFVSALGFKQMALYYAPAVFAYLLGSCIFPRLALSRFVLIAIVTAASFALLFAPFALSSLYEAYLGQTHGNPPPPPLMSRIPIDRDSIIYAPALQIFQAIHRIFPLARGLFEDKVANFWCAVHTIHKLKRYSPELLQLLSLAFTLVSIFPPALILFLYPERNTLLPGLAATSWGFFLFSFQVHEKSVLLPLLPMTLMLNSSHGLQPSIRSWVAWANVLGCWTMFPLLKRDELRVPYFVLTLLWAWLIGVPQALWEQASDKAGLFASVLQGVFYLGMIAWHVLEAFMATPLGKPDLWVVINACFGAVGFGICYLWSLWRLWQSIPAQSASALKEKAKRN